MTATMAAAKIDPSHTTKVMYTQTTPSAINAATAAVGYVFPTLKKTEQANRNALKRKFCEVDTSFCTAEFTAARKLQRESSPPTML